MTRITILPLKPTKQLLATLPLMVLIACGGGNTVSSTADNSTPDTGQALASNPENSTSTAQNGSTSSASSGNSSTSQSSTASTGTDTNNSSTSQGSTGVTSTDTSNSSTSQNSTEATSTDTNSSSTSQSGTETTNTSNSSTSQSNTEATDTNTSDSTTAQGNNTASGSSTTVTGRVADGYIQGATVCIDINENASCDEDEPVSISGEGGSYTLDIPDEWADKPIVAQVPAEAIDEDTGEAVGKEMVFSSPGKRPNFISPITTLVHQELEDNPTLDIETAEAVVLETLGLSGDEETSLFTDYVQGSQSEDAAASEKYQFVHQNARVVAKMMGEINESLKQDAFENGIDVDGDADAKKAILKLAREDIREVLSEISDAVAAKIINIKEAGTDGENQVSESLLTSELDPSLISDAFKTEYNQEEIIERIDNIKDTGNTATTKASMEELLISGIYNINLDCNDDELTDLNVNETPSLENCSVGYTHTLYSQSSNSVEVQDYTFEKDSRQWILEEQTTTEQPSFSSLVDGQWKAIDNNNLTGEVEFTDEGDAILSTEAGKIHVQASSKSLDSKKINQFLDTQKQLGFSSDAGTNDDVFPENTVMHSLLIQQESTMYTLFNWHDDDLTDGVDSCEQYAGNCNTIHLIDNGDDTPVTSLQYLINADSNDTIVISDFINNVTLGNAIDLRLDLNSTNNANLDTTQTLTGTATWIVSVDASSVSSSVIEQLDCPEIQDGEQSTLVDIATSIEVDDTSTFISSQTSNSLTNSLLENIAPTDLGNSGMLLANIPSLQNTEKNTETTTQTDLSIDNLKENVCSGAMSASELQSGLDSLLANPLGATYLSNSGIDIDSDALSNSSTLAKSQWTSTVVEGVNMIEIKIPLVISHHMGNDDYSSLLLIEEGGFVRRGARIASRGVTSEMAFDSNAFQALKPTIESMLTQ